MRDHHFTKKIVKGGSCIYCSKELEAGKWESSFSPRRHYKCIVCSCGKTNCLNVNFIGSGHDSFSGLEEKVAKSSSIKVVEKNLRFL
ncbi:hypothetical protein HYX10_01180 [Candidatus Woesearchaeota archaeon]|nr:hypothetical protein [Candidatus Woesearchaeota archaeon]